MDFPAERHFIRSVLQFNLLQKTQNERLSHSITWWLNISVASGTPIFTTTATHPLWFKHFILYSVWSLFIYLFTNSFFWSLDLRLIFSSIHLFVSHYSSSSCLIVVYWGSVLFKKIQTHPLSDTHLKSNNESLRHLKFTLVYDQWSLSMTCSHWTKCVMFSSVDTYLKE